jgi:hypothetical protein
VESIRGACLEDGDEGFLWDRTLWRGIALVELLQPTGGNLPVSDSGLLVHLLEKRIVFKIWVSLVEELDTVRGCLRIKLKVRKKKNRK